ncbi:hypothetical protein ACN47A_13385 [Myxococcus fulvus]|uniref:hypothetical protein n=1 Tax=Myxococcus fulvus TaxID=33 RepID=UPI003B9CF10B
MLSVVTDVLGDLVFGVLSVFARDKRGGAWALVLYLLLGLGLGGVSAMFWPQPLVDDFEGSLLLGLASPILAGALVAGFRGVSVWDWRYAFDRARFGLGFGVALGVGLGRVIGLLLS